MDQRRKGEGVPMKLLISVDGRPGDLEMARQNGQYRFQYTSERNDGEPREASLVQVEPGIYSVLLNGRSYEVKVVAGPEGYYVDLEGFRSVVEVRDPRSMTRGGKGGPGEGRQTVNAPMPGKVVRVMVKEGDRVEAGAGLVVVEAMKMQNELKAPKAGTVVQVKATVGATVAMGEMLVVIE
jgi:acetyl/propionyl-CoA carboxylase alpha subunit